MMSDQHPAASRRTFLKTSAAAGTLAAGHAACGMSLAAGKSTDVRPRAVTLYFLPIQARMPIKFGHQVLTHVTCARARMVVADRQGRVAEGWGETPLAVEWAWPSHLSYEVRHQSMRQFCERLAEAWAGFTEAGHPLEVGHDFLEHVLPDLVAEHNRKTALSEPLPRLAALVCASLFDLALHDAFGTLLGRPTYATYTAEFITRDLAQFVQPAEGAKVSFGGRYPQEFLISPRPQKIPAWHLVGGLDPLEPADVKPPVPGDGHPVALTDWIRRDGLNCLKVKLRGNDAPWDYDRLVRVGTIGAGQGVVWLSADFNCTVSDPAYVNTILDRLLAEHPRLHQMLLYVEQPFPYDLEAHPIDARSVSARKPLFMDESAHDWKIVRLGRSLGWSGVALKTCKTQTGALLSLCWAKAHGMPLMVQDLANPMLAQITHVQLAANAGTIMGVETNGSQFFPAASMPEARVHPGLYRRRDGQVDLSTIGGVGFGHRLSEIDRQLPPPAAQFGA
jgi:L-alanine-DL-glutamate epimerase-like enolase superfamily enzyme